LSYLIDAIEKNIAPFVSGLWDSVLLWRSVALALLVVAASAYIHRGRVRGWLLRQDTREHDKEVFRRLASVLDEQVFRDVLGFLWDTNSYSDRQYDVLADARDFLGLGDNCFLRGAVQKASSLFRASVDSLLAFTSTNFFWCGTAPDGSSRYCLQPRLDECLEGEGTREQEAEYDAYESQLHARVKSARDAFTRFRAVIKRDLLL